MKYTLDLLKNNVKGLPLRILIDTNIFIHREDFGVVPKELQELLRIIASLKAEILIHPKSIEEIKNDSDEKRREINLSKMSTYPALSAPPDPSLDIFFLDNVGASNNPHDQIDNLMLYAVYRDALSFLISEDKEVQRKASRVGLKNRVLSIQEAKETLEEFLPKENVTRPPALRDEFVYNLDINDPFFDSFKTEYPGFEKWFRKISAEPRKGYVHFQGKAISALLIRKVEDEALPTDPPIPAKKRLKLCLFKVGRIGHKIGELFIKLAVRYCVQNKISQMYLTHYTKEEDYLANLLFKFGFEVVGRQKNGEDVYLKSLVPDTARVKALSPSEIGEHYYPTFYDGKLVRKFIIPIVPKYHNRLFSDCRDRQTTMDEYCGNFIIEGNTISKAYLSHSKIDRISKGDILLFYRSHDRKELTALGILESVYRTKNPKKIAEIVRNRTVYSLEEIQELANKTVLVMLFRWHFYLPRPLKINKLKEMNVLKSAPQTIMKIEHSKYLQVKKEGKLDERYTVD